MLLFFFFALSFLLSFSSSSSSSSDDDKSYISHFCDNTTLFANHSIYQSNLNILLSSLSSYATSNSKNGYRNATVGQSPNTVYGHYFCRGDATHDVCRDCVKAAATDIFQRCTYCKFGYIWYDMCTLRYSSQSFNTFFNFIPGYTSDNHSVSDVTMFNQLLAETMKEAATTAASDSGRFGTRDANFSEFQKLYCLAQCSPDMSGFDCNRCLMETIALLPSCCSGKQGGRVFHPSCNIRFEMFPFYRVTDSVPLPSPPSNRATSPDPGKQGSSSSKFVVILVPIAAAGVIIFCILCFLIWKKKKGPSKNNEQKEIESAAASFQFEFSTILAATNNFAEVNKIGEGGFGSVYRGELPDGQEIAVKRLSKHSEQGAEEFKNEVVLVAKIQHRNLVSLLGFCLEKEEKILIYEFVPNKSLNFFLFDPEKCKQLDWERRSNIIGGIARGLLYLHNDSHIRIIHRDLKASNILLDEEMNAKISDFGMAKIFGMDQTQANTNRIVGTYGYMAPEYVMYGNFSVKSDVFSFGVLVLEIVSGKKNSSFYQTDFAEDLISHAWRHWKAGTISDLIDPNLRESCSRSEVMRYVQIGLLCVQEDVADRPTMANIVLMLNRLNINLPLPSQPAYFLHSRIESESDQSKSRPTAISFNEMSVTELEPR